MQVIRRSIWKPAFMALSIVGIGMLSANVFTPSPALGAGKTALNELSDAFEGVSKEASPAVVAIMVEKKMAGALQGPQGMSPDDMFERFFGPGLRGPNQPDPRSQGRRRVPVQRGQGSGFIISEDGYIITNNHVVGDKDVEVTVKLSDGHEHKAEVIGADPQTDVAVIKIDAKNLPTVKLGDSDDLRVGQWVLAIGSPFGLEHSVTAGIVSARGRGNVGIVDYSDFIQTDAAINPGNSGGPLLDLDGKVVGLNTAILSRSGGYMGVGFAIPSNMVEFIKDQLIDKGEIARGYLGVGIQQLTSDLAEALGIKEGEGVLIGDVKDGSPANEAGIEREDVVVEFDGRPTKEMRAFRSRVAATSPGKEVKIVVLRDGKRLTKTVKIGTLDLDAVASLGEPATLDKLGIAVQDLTDEIADRLGYEGDGGVVVSKVVPGSPADGRLKPGVVIEFVNRNPVESVAEFNQAIEESDPEKPVLLLVVDGEMSQYVTLRIED
jgi:serine protease Do